MSLGITPSSEFVYLNRKPAACKDGDDDGYQLHNALLISILNQISLNHKWTISFDFACLASLYKLYFSYYGLVDPTDTTVGYYFVILCYCCSSIAVK